jgi:plastocyanin
MSKLASFLSAILAVAGASVASAQGGEGSISGTVKLEGAPKKPKKLNGQLDGDKFCGPQRGGKDVFAEDLIVAEDTAVANVLVYVKSGHKDKGAAPKEAAVLDQKGCLYHPHVLVVQTGQTLTVKNSDDTMHNIHSVPKINPEFNEGQGKAGMSFDRTFNTPEIGIFVKCDVHKWMGAWLHVLDHSYWALTGPDGKFTIKGLPAGTYELEVWHEKLANGKESKPLKQSVTVGDKEAKTQDFTLKAQ